MGKQDQIEQDSAPATQEKKKGTFFKWLIIGIAVILIVAGGITGGIFYFNNFSNGNENQKKEKEMAGILWPMEPFIVNLADNTGERYLKVVIQLEVTDQENTVFLDELKPKFRDCVLDILASKSFSELMDINGKQRLRDDIASKLSKFLSKGKIVRVYFTEFVIQ